MQATETSWSYTQLHCPGMIVVSVMSFAY